MEDSRRLQSRPQSSRPKIALPEPTESLEEYIDILLEHQKSCEKSGKYLEADLTKKKLIEIRDLLNKQNKDETKNRFEQEMIEVEKAKQNELNEFNAFWDNKIQEFNQEAAKIEEQILQRHDEELQRFNQEIQNSIPLKPKDSVELLNTRKIEETLAKQQDYLEAYKVQQKVLQLEKEEMEKWSYTRSSKINNLLTQLKTRQQNELNALKKRIISGQDEQAKIRQTELERLVQKYQNVKKDLSVSQNQELSKLDKTIKINQSMNVSKMNASRMGSQMLKGSKQLD